jgi:uncharacterized protein (TIGR00290 family)
MAPDESTRALLSWSSGKDSAYSLHVIQKSGMCQVVGLLTTVTDTFGRVSMHGVREALLDRQAQAVGLPLVKVRLPFPCPNETYERLMSETLAAVRSDGVRHVAFGDLFLEDIRSYREAKMRSVGMECLFPLWHRPTAELAREMIASGLKARLCCVDPRHLDRSFAGREFDDALLRDLPPSVDPCGERGEFHTCVTDSPSFRAPIAIRVGETVERDGFVFTDMIPT